MKYFIIINIKKNLNLLHINTISIFFFKQKLIRLISFVNTTYVFI